jgi:hypothetical protein
MSGFARSLAPTVRQLLWTVRVFAVPVSDDHGNHCHPFGITMKTSLRWAAPRETFGGVSFQVIAQRNDGTNVSALVPVRGDIPIAPAR